MATGVSAGWWRGLVLVGDADNGEVSWGSALGLGDVESSDLTGDLTVDLSVVSEDGERVVVGTGDSAGEVVAILDTGVVAVGVVAVAAAAVAVEVEDAVEVLDLRDLAKRGWFLRWPMVGGDVLGE